MTRGSSAAGNAKKSAAVSRPVPVGPGDRSETRAYLPTGELAAEPQGAEGTSAEADRIGPGKRLWKRRPAKPGLGNPFWISTFPQPRRRRTFGYIPNGATICPTVTFLNGLTGGQFGKAFSCISVESGAGVVRGIGSPQRWACSAGPPIRHDKIREPSESHAGRPATHSA